jgi:antitoxin HigA-1
MNKIHDIPLENITDEFLENAHPGTAIRLDYLPEMGITEYRFAKLLRITQSHLAEILEGKRNITANIAIRLGLLFNQTPEMWIGLQNSYDLLKAKRQYAEEYAKIVAFEWPAVNDGEINKAA